MAAETVDIFYIVILVDKIIKLYYENWRMKNNLYGIKDIENEEIL